MTGIFFSQEADTFWLIAKLATLVVILLYIVFAYVIVKQVILMNETLEVGFEKTMKAIAYAHLIFSIFVFLLAVVVL